MNTRTKLFFSAVIMFVGAFAALPIKGYLVTDGEKFWTAVIIGTYMTAGLIPWADWPSRFMRSSWHINLGTHALAFLVPILTITCGMFASALAFGLPLD